jgi:hypothetical protein
MISLLLQELLLGYEHAVATEGEDAPTFIEETVFDDKVSFPSPS